MASDATYDQLKWYAKEQRLKVGKDEHGKDMTVTCFKRGANLMVKYYCGLDATGLSIEKVKTWDPAFDPPEADHKKQNRRVKKAWQSKAGEDAEVKADEDLASEPAGGMVKVARASAKRAKSTDTSGPNEEPPAKKRKTFTLQNINEAFGSRWVVLSRQQIQNVIQQLKVQLKLKHAPKDHVIIAMKRYSDAMGREFSPFDSVAWDNFLVETKQQVEDSDLTDMIIEVVGTSEIGSNAGSGDRQAVAEPDNLLDLFNSPNDQKEKWGRDWKKVWLNETLGKESAQGLDGLVKWGTDLLASLTG